jgi:hypothetical protein
LTGRTRLNGLGTNGLAFINTGRGRDLGGALLALDTRNVSNAPVSWLGGTVLANVRVYAIRLQYRVGLTNDFADVLDSEGQPVEYLRNATNGHVQTLGPVPARRRPRPGMRPAPLALLLGFRHQRRPRPIAPRRNRRGQPPRRFLRLAAGRLHPEELADPDVSGPLAESGGIPNLLRYAFGLDRAGNFDAVRPTAEVLENVRVFRHRRLLADDSGVDYVVESASDLQLADWDAADVGTDLIDQGAVPTGDGQTETVEYHLDDDLLPSPRYIRLKVTLTE